MLSRRLLILSLFLALPCDLSAQTPTIQVLVYDQAGLQLSTFQRFLERTRAILMTAGLSVQVEACASGVEGPCAPRTESARRLQVRVLARSPKRAGHAGHHPLGESFAGQDGGTYASVFLERVTDAAAEANVPVVIVLAHAAAHEIGHLLLGDESHTPRGLMKAQWDRNDFQAMHQNRLHFTAQQVRMLSGRYGVSPSATIAQNPALARTH
jgi:hypothetical protein